MPFPFDLPESDRTDVDGIVRIREIGLDWK